MRTTIGITALALCLVFSTEAWAQSPTFSDGDFNPANYDTVQTGTGSSTATTEATGGHPDDPDLARFRDEAAALVR